MDADADIVRLDQSDPERGSAMGLYYSILPVLSLQSPSIICSALYNKSDHAALTAFPASSTYGKH